MAQPLAANIWAGLCLLILAIAVAECCRPDNDNQCDKDAECCSGWCWRGNSNWATGVCKSRGGSTTTKRPPSGGAPTQRQFEDAVMSCTDMNGGKYPRPSRDQYQKFVGGLRGGSIGSKQEAAMALANFIMESGGLQYKKELACVNTGCPGHYDSAGCEVPGKRYYGRGYIQLSWCYNYRDAGRGLGVGDQYLNNPDQVAEEKPAWDTSFWFWKDRVHNKYPNEISQGKFGYTIKAINGGLECGSPSQDFARKRDKRFEYYANVMRAFGLQANGDRSGC